MSIEVSCINSIEDDYKLVLFSFSGKHTFPAVSPIPPAADAASAKKEIIDTPIFWIPTFYLHRLTACIGF